mmetsp:Transcript_16510/g.40900  ORF Transcript_16510/g.40900 Transcript_16510/m.40900 type:complete len:234 (+) Transcript_16510:227-928(+)
MCARPRPPCGLRMISSSDRSLPWTQACAWGHTLSPQSTELVVVDLGGWTRRLGSLAVVVASARWVPQPGVGASLHVVGGILGAHLAETLLEGLDTALAEGLLQLLGERLEDLRRVEAAGSHLLALLQRHVLGLPFPLLLLLHLLLLHLCARLDVRDVLGEVIVEGLPRLIARGHLPEERPDGVPSIAPRHRLGEVAHVREQQILPGRLLHLPSLALDLQVDAVQQVEARGVLA